MIVKETSGFTDKFTMDTCSSDTQLDRYGAQPITPSVSAISLPDDETLLVAPSTDGKVYRWKVRSKPDTPSANWTLTSLTTLVSTGTEPLRFYGSAALADLDSNGTYEVIVGGNDGRVYVWDGSTTQSIFYGASGAWPCATGQMIESSPAVADIDDDGKPEIVVGSDDRRVYAWHADGSAVNGWPCETGGPVFGSPALAEIDGQPGLEVVAVSLDGKAYAWNASGVLLDWWPKRMNTALYSSPAVADIHRAGGRQSVVFGGYDGRVFVFDLARRSSAPNAGWKQFRNGPARQGVAN